MRIAERIQTLIHALEVGRFSRWLTLLALTLAVVGLAEWYDLSLYRSFSSPEAMDAAQVGRNLAEGKGYSTDFLRPFSFYLVQKRNQEIHPDWLTNTNLDLAVVRSPHPDLANAPVYPALLAGLMKLAKPDWKVELRQPFWSQAGHFLRYAPEFSIALLNQFLLLTVVTMTFYITRRLFDEVSAWLAALLTLGVDELWKFSVSGQSTLLLLLIFLGLIWCLVRLEEMGRAGASRFQRLLWLAAAAGLLTGLGMLTRYAFGWIIIPVSLFLGLFGGTRRLWLIGAALLAFGLSVAPWMIRNYSVSGTFFGTAGYAVMEGTPAFPGSHLMQSLTPNFSMLYWTYYLGKLSNNLRFILQGDLLRLGGGWLAILFFAGLMVGLPNLAARRVRYFAMGCLGLLMVVQALGKTELSIISPEVNSENLLVLLTPLVVMFGAAFFLAMLRQMNAPSPDIRLAVVVLVGAICCQPLALNLMGPKTSPVAYPPYYPPEIQKISGWMRPDELLMSDIPWAVAWYGERRCVWVTTNSRGDFYALNDNIKHVSGLYLTMITLDARLFTDCILGGVNNSWSNFAFKTLAANQNQIPAGFPLSVFPYPSLDCGVFLTDRVRWQTE